MKLNWKTSLIVCSSLFLLFLAVHYWQNITGFLQIVAASSTTLIFGAVIAYIVNILMSGYEKRIAPRCRKPLWLRMKRPVCMLLAFLTLALAIFILFQLIVPQLVDCFNQLIEALGNSVPKVVDWLNERVDLNALFSNGEAVQTVADSTQQLSADTAMAEQTAGSIMQQIPQTKAEWRTLLERYAHVLLTGVGGVMNFAVSAISSLVGWIVTIFIGFIFAINILAGKEKLGNQFNRLFTRIFGDRLMGGIRHIMQVLNDCFRSYIVGQLTEAVILGVLCGLGMWILRLKFPVMIGTLVGVTALIPVAGGYIGAGIGAIMLFSEGWMQAVVFLAFILILQQVEGNVIYPRTVGSSLQLPGLWVLAAVTIGGGVMGITGMLIFVPLTAAAYRLIGEWVNEQGKPSLAEWIMNFGKDEGPTPIAEISQQNATEALSQELPAQKERRPVQQGRRRKR